MREVPPIVVFDKIERRNRTIVDSVTDENGLRWFMFADEPEGGGWRNAYDTDEAEVKR